MIGLSIGQFDVVLEEDIVCFDEVVVMGLVLGVKCFNFGNVVVIISFVELVGNIILQIVDNVFYGKFIGVNIMVNGGLLGGGVSVQLCGIFMLGVGFS